MSQKDIPHMTEMQRFVGVRTGEFDHHRFSAASGLFFSRKFFSAYCVELAEPVCFAQRQIQKTFHHVERNHQWIFADEILTKAITQYIGRLACCFHKWKSNQREIALEFPARFLKHDVFDRNGKKILK